MKRLKIKLYTTYTCKYCGWIGDFIRCPNCGYEREI